jgi:hypothetical protein
MDSSDFLKQDFSECYNQLRHYDNNITDSFKFIFTVYVALVAGAISLLDIQLKFDLLFLSKALIITSIIFCLFILFYIIELRVYFVRVARYLNEIRAHYLNNNEEGFENATKFYSDKSKPMYFSLTSSHLILAFIVSALNSFSIGLFFYVYKSEFKFGQVLISIIIFALQIFLIYMYLKRKQTKG